MSEFTTVYVKQETAEKIRRLAEKEGRKQYALVDLALDFYAKSLEPKPETTPTPQPQQ